MSYEFFDLEVRSDGLNKLRSYYTEWPGKVVGAAVRAGRRADTPIVRSLRAHTPRRSGFLQGSEETEVEGPFALRIEAGAFYASFVDKRRGFFEPGIGAALPEVDAIYEDEYARVVAEAPA